MRKWEGNVDVGKSNRWEGFRVKNKRWRASSAAWILQDLWDSEGAHGMATDPMFGHFDRIPKPFSKFVCSRIDAYDKYWSIGVATCFLKQSISKAASHVNHQKITKMVSRGSTYREIGRSRPNFATVSVRAIFGARNFSSGWRSIARVRK